MVSLWVDSAGWTIYGVSLIGFNWLNDIWWQCGWIQLVERYMVSVCVCVCVCGFNWLNDIWCQCGWIELVERYIVSVWLDSTGWMIYGVCGWIQLVQNRIQWTAFVNTGTKLRFAWKAGNLSNRWTSVNFYILRGSLLHEFCYLSSFCGIHNTNKNKIIIFINFCVYWKFFIRFRNEHKIWTDHALRHVPRNTMESALTIMIKFY